MPTEPAHDAAPLDSAAWQRLLEVMERLASSSDLQEVLRLIIDSMRDCLDADRASVFEYDHAAHELFAREAHGLAEALRFSADRGLAGEAVRTRSIINVRECYADPRFNPEVDRATGYRTRCMLTIPLVSFAGTLEGVAQVLNKKSGDPAVFGPRDESIARALASQAAVAVRRAHLLEAERRKNKMEADLELARSIQQSALPDEVPALPGFDLAARTTPAEETGGDAFDCFLAASPDGAAPRLLFFMADAAGHGIGPALSVMQARSMVRMAGLLGAPLDDLVGRLASQLALELPIGRFVTAIVGELDPASARLAYLSAGQAPLLILRADGSHERRDADEPPLGLAEPPLRASPPINLQPGDAFVLLSDGFLEARNAAGEQFGVDRAVECLHSARPRGAASMLDTLQAAVHAFTRGSAPDDDRTGVILLRV